MGFESDSSERRKEIELGIFGKEKEDTQEAPLRALHGHGVSIALWLEVKADVLSIKVELGPPYSPVFRL